MNPNKIIKIFNETQDASNWNENKELEYYKLASIHMNHPSCVDVLTVVNGIYQVPYFLSVIVNNEIDSFKKYWKQSEYFPLGTYLNPVMHGLLTEGKILEAIKKNRPNIFLQHLKSPGNVRDIFQIFYMLKNFSCYQNKFDRRKLLIQAGISPDVKIKKNTKKL